mgnify:CR=1 FL=1
MLHDGRESPTLSSVLPRIDRDRPLGRGRRASNAVAKPVRGAHDGCRLAHSRASHVAGYHLLVVKKGVRGSRKAAGAAAAERRFASWPSQRREAVASGPRTRTLVRYSPRGGPEVRRKAARRAKSGAFGATPFACTRHRSLTFASPSAAARSARVP